jgi:hypothetical protein
VITPRIIVVADRERPGSYGWCSEHRDSD